jgi:hypothetical protein
MNQKAPQILKSELKHEPIQRRRGGATPYIVWRSNHKLNIFTNLSVREDINIYIYTNPSVREKNIYLILFISTCKLAIHSLTWSCKIYKFVDINASFFRYIQKYTWHSYAHACIYRYINTSTLQRKKKIQIILLARENVTPFPDGAHQECNHCSLDSRCRILLIHMVHWRNLL